MNIKKLHIIDSQKQSSSPRRRSRMQKISTQKSNQIFTDHLSAYTFLVTIILYLIFFALFRFRTINSIPLNIYAMVILVPIFLTDALKILTESFGKKTLYKPAEDLSKVTVLIPSMNGSSTIGITIENLLRKFSADSIIVSSNGSTDDTLAISKRYGVRILDISAPVGKVEAINQALYLVKTPYVLIMDDDTLLGNAIVPTNALDEGYKGAAFRVLPVIEGMLSRIQMHEYRKSMDIARSSHNSSGTVQSISGAIGLFYTNELQRQISLHTGEFAGEDLQRTLLIHLENEDKGVVIADSLVYTYVPRTFKDLFKQRVFGWNPGFYTNLGIFSKLLFKKHVPLKMRIEAFYSIFVICALDPFRLVSLPILLFSPTYMIIFYFTYVILETIPYVIMGRKEPYWIILISPMYGLFNFIARILATIVFFFRRISVTLSKTDKYDHYRKAAFFPRFVSFSLSSTVLSGALFGYSYITILPHEDPNLAIVTESKQQIVSPLSPITPIPVLTNIVKNADYIYTAKAGDSLWTLSKQAVADYLYDKQAALTPREKNRMTYLVTQEAEDKIISPSKEYHFTPAVLSAALEKVQEL